jgi:glycosyltransferase involved in cell wall biosynthesis
LQEALQNPQECQRRGVNAQKYALENFSWDAIAKQMIQAYQGIKGCKGVGV